MGIFELPPLSQWRQMATKHHLEHRNRLGNVIACFQKRSWRGPAMRTCFSGNCLRICTKGIPKTGSAKLRTLRTHNRLTDGQGPIGVRTAQNNQRSAPRFARRFAQLIQIREYLLINAVPDIPRCSRPDNRIL